MVSDWTAEQTAAFHQQLAAVRWSVEQTAAMAACDEAFRRWLETCDLTAEQRETLTGCWDACRNGTEDSLRFYAAGRAMKAAGEGVPDA